MGFNKSINILCNKCLTSKTFVDIIPTDLAALVIPPPYRIVHFTYIGTTIQIISIPKSRHFWIYQHVLLLCTSYNWIDNWIDWINSAAAWIHKLPKTKIQNQWRRKDCNFQTQLVFSFDSFWNWDSPSCYVIVLCRICQLKIGIQRIKYPIAN